MRRIAKRTAKPHANAEQFVEGMKQLIQTAKSGGIEVVKKKHGIPMPNVKLFTLPSITSKHVKETRKALGVSQAMFAMILGASAQSVRSWEQGVKPPSGVARRLIGEIRDNPDYWRKRFELKFVQTA